MITLAQALWLLVAALGLALSTSYAGLPVLGQGAFVAVGAVGTARLGPGGAGLPLLIAVLLAVGLSAVAGIVVGLAFSRLEGATLALATWALAWLAWRALLVFPRLGGGEDGLVRPAPAHLITHTFGLDLVLTPTVHVVVAGVICGLLVLTLIRLSTGPGGLDLAALREGPLLAQSLGVPVARRRLTVLAVTAALGGLSGAGTLALLGLIAPSDVSPLLSLQLVVAALAGGTAQWWGPVLGVAVLTAIPHVLGSGQHGRALITALLLVAVLGLRVPLRDKRSRPSNGLLTAPSSSSAAVGEVRVEARGLAVFYGALTALEGVDLQLRAGQVHAVVGPNGSGKSTLLQVLAGARSPDAGDVRLDGQPLGRGVLERVREGVVRTPQSTVTMAGLSPARQVALGHRVRGPRGAVLRHLTATPSTRRGTSNDRPLRLTGLQGVADADPRQLPVGAQRLLQVARAVATDATVLLLDEPAAGMTADERTVLVACLRALAAEGFAILLVEHDMRLVGQVAEVVTVLQAGRVVASGDPATIRADESVRRAYLGS